MIVDAGSNDGSIEVEKEFADVVYVHPPLYGKPITRGRGRQIATELAKGDIILTIDGDCHPNPHYLERFRQFFFTHPEVSWAYVDLYDTKNRKMRNLAAKMGVMYWKGIGCNSAFRRDVFETINGYQDRNWWEDTELFNEFPGEKVWIDNPIKMDICARWLDGLWVGMFGALTVTYLSWKFFCTEGGGLEDVTEW